MAALALAAGPSLALGGNYHWTGNAGPSPDFPFFHVWVDSGNWDCFGFCTAVPSWPDDPADDAGIHKSEGFTIATPTVTIDDLRVGALIGTQLRFDGGGKVSCNTFTVVGPHTAGQLTQFSVLNGAIVDTVD